jgi:lipopolysaccharide exporter
MTNDSPSGEELRAAAVHGLRWSALSRPTIEIIQLVSVVVLARLIVPAEFGRFAIALIAQEVAVVIIGAGLTAALVQRKTLDRQHLQTGMALGLIAGLALGALTLLAAGLIVAPIFGARTAVFVRLMAPLCLVSALGIAPSATLQRRMAFRRLSEIEVLSALARLGVCVGLALNGFGGESLVFGALVGVSTVAIMTWISAPPPPPRIQPAAARELLSFSLPVSLASISWIGFSNVDYVIIGARLGAIQTGFYFRAYTVAVEYQTKVATVMSGVGFPVLSRAPNAAELRQLYHQMVRLLTIVLFPLLVLLAISAPVLVPFVFGPRWAPAVVPVQILALGGASTLVINAVGTVLMATGRGRALLGYGTAHFLVYGLTVLLVVRLGIVAVAVDAAIVHTVFLVIAYRLMLRGSTERPLHRLWSDIAPAVVSCIGLVAVALPASFALTAADVPAILWLAGLGLVAGPSYLLTLRVCFPAAWRNQRAAFERILGRRLQLPGTKRRLAAADAQAAG